MQQGTRVAGSIMINKNAGANAPVSTGVATRVARASLTLSAMLLVLQVSGASAQNFAFNAVQIDGNQRVADSTILSFAGISI